MTEDELSNAGIRVEIEDPVAVVTIDRPARLNALTFATIRGLRVVAERLTADSRVVGIVITGAGRAFSAGLDAEDLSRATTDGAPTDLYDPSSPPALFSYLLSTPKPVIAAVNGVAAGGGFVLAMMCDLRFAADDASFTTVFAKRGLIAEHGTSWLLPRLVGTGRGLDLLWSGRRFDAAEALRLGFVERVMPKSELLGAARAYVVELAATVSPRSIAVMKAQVYRGLSMTFPDAMLDAYREMDRALPTPHAKEGVQSLLEKRPPRFPRWTGKD